MKIYSFWSADTTFFTTSKSKKKAQEIGLENLKSYTDTCKYINESPEMTDIDYFVPTEIYEVSKVEFIHSMKTDKDTMILDNELYKLIEGK